MMVKEERFRSDSKLLRELAEDAYETCVSAIDALHALLREHDDHDEEEEEEVVVATVAVAGASSASEHDCGAAHHLPAAEPVPNPFTTLRDLAPQLEAVAMRLARAAAAATPEVAAPVDDSAVNYFRGRGYPEGQIQMMKKYWAAYKMGKEAGRQAELEHGGWATLGAGATKKRVMIYKGHAFEPPSDRDYAVPGPLKHLDKYNRDSKKVDRIVSGEDVPVVPQTNEDYPWWLPRASRV